MSGDIIVGIDLGTTNSCVAVMVDGEVIVIPDEDGKRIQSSVVSFMEDGSLIIGNEARQELIADPRNTVFSAKRFIGYPYDSKEARKLRAQLPYRVVRGDDQNSMIEIRGEAYALPEISALVLHRMRGWPGCMLSLTRAVVVPVLSLDRGTIPN